MTTPPNPEESIVDAALEMPAHERAAYLDKLCGNDRQLRQLVDALLHAHKKIISSQIVPPRDASATPTQSDSAPGEGAPERRAPGATTMAVSVTPIEKPGDHIGRYKLLEQIGEGGFGVVYVAEQREPVKRRVALKIVKLGMDTRQVVGRFEAERQALALMDHPNIAKVFDGGATEAGRPYFVMELVRGIKITDYCDQNNLPTLQRLELFVLICRAIQHAHQKGIIHRDIKPSNILVTLHDGVPVPKVIDFGIAKATQQELTEKTVYTQFQQFIGTPAYMSPEQAEMSGLDIDTRSDIYSLGVLLYELLTGKTPFDGKKLIEASLDEIRRVIREQEPPRPSTRVTQELTSKSKGKNQKSPDESSSRRMAQLRKLIDLLRGDLDWIVMKCLEKDRTRRYDTANGLASDVQRYLDTEPVMARPPSHWYRVQKLIRRNKLAFGAASAVAGALLIGLGLSTWLFLKERGTRQRAETAEREQARQRQQAEAEGKKARSEAAKSQQVARFLQDMLQSVGPAVAQGRDTAMLQEILDKTAERVSNDLTNQPEVEAELRTTIGSVYQELSQYFKAEDALRKGLALRRRVPGGDLGVASSLRNLGHLLGEAGKPSEARAMLEEALAINRRQLGNEDIEVANCLSDLALTLYYTGTIAETEQMVREALAIQKKVLGREHQDVAWSLEWLAGLQAEKGELAEAEETQRQAVAMYNKVLVGDRHPTRGSSLCNLAEILLHRGKLFEAESAARESLVRFDEAASTEYPFLPGGMLDGLTEVLRMEGKSGEAVALAHERMAKNEQALNEKLVRRPGGSDLLYYRGLLRGRMGRWHEAAADLSKVVELRPDSHVALAELAAVLVEDGDLEAHSRLCAQIRERFGSAASEEIGMAAARACLIVPSLDSLGIVTDSKLADRAVTLYKGDLFLISCQSCKALAEYRQGRFTGAVEWALKALSQPEYGFDRETVQKDHYRRVEANMLLAMSDYQLLQLDHARVALARGLEIADKKLPKMESGDLGTYWADWAFADVLIREAKVLIEGGAKAGEATNTGDSPSLRKDPP